MGYTDSDEIIFSRALLRGVRHAETGAGVPGMWKRRIVHGGELNPISDCLQSIVVRRLSTAHPKQLAKSSSP
jgi:hypothetical protein